MTTSIETEACLVCGTVGGAENRLDGMIRRCQGCTFSWTAQDCLPPEELYVEDYFEGSGYADYYQPKARRFESALRLKWLLSTGRPASLLEAGSAAGFFVEAALAAGIDARGIEISHAAVDYAQQRLDMPVEQGTFESSSVTAEFDAVCAFHVLEHVEDPVEFVIRAREALVPGGRIALEVPNIAAAAAGRLGSSWPNLQLQYHRWHFTPVSLGRLLGDCGFEVIAQDTVFSRFYWQRWGRVRHTRELLLADAVASRSLRVSHPTMGDCLRVVARRTGTGSRS